MQFLRNLTKYEKFNFKRVQCLIGDGCHIDLSSKKCNGVAYYMHRDHRIHDNWSVVFGQKLALDNNLPFHVLTDFPSNWPSHPEATKRRADFAVGGLKEIQEDCHKYGFGFHFFQDSKTSVCEHILNFVKTSNIRCIVVDFSPLNLYRSEIEKLVTELESIGGCLLYQVDSHNIVPVWEASQSDEPRATEMRQRILAKFDEFFTDFPQIQVHPFSCEYKSDPIDWNEVIDSLVIDKSVTLPEWAKPGFRNGLCKFQEFIDMGLKDYNEKRNNPTINAISHLSPWLNFGHISAQRVIADIMQYRDEHQASVAKFVDEAIVWREMSDNYCHYNRNYDNLEGAPMWAIESLNKQRNTKREYVYSFEQFDGAETHDPLWNAAQIQLKEEGKMHGYMRMYWAKKILEWTQNPDNAIKYALYFNDHYSIDGADPNGYAGVMWSIAGVHDPPKWGERPVYGKIRYMSFNGARNKFDVHKYIAQYTQQGITSTRNVAPPFSPANQEPKNSASSKQGQSFKRKGRRVQGPWGGSQDS